MVEAWARIETGGACDDHVEEGNGGGGAKGKGHIPSDACDHMTVEIALAEKCGRSRARSEPMRRLLLHVHGRGGSLDEFRLFPEPQAPGDPPRGSLQPEVQGLGWSAGALVRSSYRRFMREIDRRLGKKGVPTISS